MRHTVISFVIHFLVGIQVVLFLIAFDGDTAPAFDLLNRNQLGMFGLILIGAYQAGALSVRVRLIKRQEDYNEQMA